VESVLENFVKAVIELIQTGINKQTKNVIINSKK